MQNQSAVDNMATKQVTLTVEGRHGAPSEAFQGADKNILRVNLVSDHNSKAKSWIQIKYSGENSKAAKIARQKSRLDRLKSLEPLKRPHLNSGCQRAICKAIAPDAKPRRNGELFKNVNADFDVPDEHQSSSQQKREGANETYKNFDDDRLKRHVSAIYLLFASLKSIPRGIQNKVQKRLSFAEDLLKSFRNSRVAATSHAKVARIFVLLRPKLTPDMSRSEPIKAREGEIEGSFGRIIVRSFFLSEMSCLPTGRDIFGSIVQGEGRMVKIHDYGVRKLIWDRQDGCRGNSDEAYWNELTMEIELMIETRGSMVCNEDESALNRGGGRERQREEARLEGERQYLRKSYKDYSVVALAATPPPPRSTTVGLLLSRQDGKSAEEGKNKHEKKYFDPTSDMDSDDAGGRIGMQTELSEKRLSKDKDQEVLEPGTTREED
ncbi:hypothetical protein BY996DRAFT_6532889 [Phakopsora pachyrhizi]|nr:hypothetical protein BY996DRAFT_6532889 [Phakopsora pachyrhizi]